MCRNAPKAESMFDRSSSKPPSRLAHLQDSESKWISCLNLWFQDTDRTDRNPMAKMSKPPHLHQPLQKSSNQRRRLRRLPQRESFRLRQVGPRPCPLEHIAHRSQLCATLFSFASCSAVLSRQRCLQQHPPGQDLATRRRRPKRSIKLAQNTTRCRLQQESGRRTRSQQQSTYGPKRTFH